jgi:hypothetical protein
MASAAQRDWSNGMRERNLCAVAPPPVPTQFEICVHRLQLDNLPHLWPHDDALRAWVKANKNQRYVPEELLSAWGMHVIMND